METFEEHYDSMCAAIARRMPTADMELIDKAVRYADEKHKSQKRKDGSPYIIHPLAVAEIVVEMGLDMDAILGALLHDCIEDTDASHEEIEKLFGSTVAELVEGVPKNIAEQPALLTVAKAGVLLNANTEEALRDGLDLLKYAWDLGSYSEQGAALQAELTARLQETLYEKAVSLLHKGDAYAARDYLKELGDYKDAATILVYTHALIDSRWCDVILYRWALESLQAIPLDYNGEFAEEIAALRDALPGKIAEQEQIDAERAANLAQQQQQQKPKPPQTFNYGGGSTDTGPGSGHSLREDYDDPENLYEDGDYDDLDEAWDEWEEGW